MESHHYEFSRPDLLRILAIPAAGCITIAVLVRAFAMIPIVPAPRPALDVDRTVIVQQIDASTQAAPAETLLIGDSSCLMNVDATYLSQLSGENVINLGTLSFLGLESFAQLLTNYLESHERPPSQIVLLTHPDFVRKNSTSRAHTEAFNHYLQQEDHSYVSNATWDLRRWLGIHIVKGRLLGRLPLPLKGAFRDYYGFTTDLMAFMHAHNGSAVDPRTFQEDELKGSSDYRVAKYHSRSSTSMLSILSEQVDFYIGLTPLPQEFVDRAFSQEYEALLADWASLFPGSIVLSGLPPTLDKRHFSTKTHLNESATKDYTQRLHSHLTSLGTH